MPKQLQVHLRWALYAGERILSFFLSIIKDSINGNLCNTGEGSLSVTEIGRMLKNDGVTDI